MANRLPGISNKHKICIICEGNEEYKYLERLNELHVWNEIYDISLVNAEGNGNIPARYQDRYQNGSYEVIKTPAKKTNAALIEKYTGVKDYKGRADQIDEIMKCVTDDNIDVMKDHVGKIDTDETVVGSTNFSKWVSLFDDGDATWITTLNQILES